MREIALRARRGPRRELLRWPVARRHGRVRLGLGAPRPGDPLVDDAEGTVTPAAGLVINFAGKTIYHLGDTALFSDLALPGKRDTSTSR
jgi:L-ascorbate metabolism protein UlaG (beta-lactamase superfamily)